MKVVDSHVHVWDPARLDYAWLDNDADLNKPFLPQSLPHTLSDTGAAVFVQADCRQDQALKEVDWVSGLATEWPQLSAVVAFAPIVRGDEMRADLEQLAQRPLVRGVRQLFQDLDDSVILAPQTITGGQRVAEAGLTFDACIRYGQLDALAEFATQLPELGIVLDHMGKPPVAEGALDRWSVGIRNLARRPNVVVKLSGAGAEAAPGSPLERQALPFIKETIEIFGPERCMVGSDWPVSLKSAASYQAWIDLVLNNALAGASTSELDSVAWAAASRFYRLDVF